MSEDPKHNPGESEFGPHDDDAPLLRDHAGLPGSVEVVDAHLEETYRSKLW